jgi:hypothetical protein
MNHPKKPFQKNTQKAPSPILFVPLPNNTNQIEKPDSSVIRQEKWREKKERTCLGFQIEASGPSHQPAPIYVKSKT